MQYSKPIPCFVVLLVGCAVGMRTRLEEPQTVEKLSSGLSNRSHFRSSLEGLEKKGRAAPTVEEKKGVCDALMKGLKVAEDEDAGKKICAVIGRLGMGEGYIPLLHDALRANDSLFYEHELHYFLLSNVTVVASLQNWEAAFDLALSQLSDKQREREDGEFTEADGIALEIPKARLFADRQKKLAQALASLGLGERYTSDEWFHLFVADDDVLKRYKLKNLLLPNDNSTFDSMQQELLEHYIKNGVAHDQFSEVVELAKQTVMPNNFTDLLAARLKDFTGNQLPTRSENMYARMAAETLSECGPHVGVYYAKHLQEFTGDYKGMSDDKQCEYWRLMKTLCQNASSEEKRDLFKEAESLDPLVGVKRVWWTLKNNPVRMGVLGFMDFVEWVSHK